jgi:hypothetical protein
MIEAKMALKSKLPIRARLGLLALAGSVLGGSVPAHAQQFAADLVVTHDGAVAEPAGRLRVLGDKVRLETPQSADGFFLVDAAKPAAYFVRPGARTFMEARQSSPLTRLFVAVDPDDPCRQWQVMAHLAGLADGDYRCERRGEETLGGHSTIAYRALSSGGKPLLGWIDRERRFPLRITTEDGAVITVENIRDESQPGTLFEIPPAFRKFDPLALIQRIKHSDVWVEGAKVPKPAQ